MECRGHTLKNAIDAVESTLSQLPTGALSHASSPPENLGRLRSRNAKTGAPGSSLYVATVLSLAAAAIHLWVAPDHLEEWWGYGAFMLVAAAAQSVYGLALLRWHTRTLLLLGISGNLTIVVLYLITRTIGIPFGPHAGHTEAIGGMDLFCTVSEVALVMALIMLLQNLHHIKAVLPAIVTLVVALGAGGILVASGIVSSGLTKNPENSFPIAQDVRTGFGIVAVEHVEKLPGLTAEQLAGMTHGIQGNIPPDEVLVQASVVLTNLLDHPVGYSPEHFSLISEKGDSPIPLTRSTFQEGTLQPAASIEGTLSFVAPRDGSGLWIQYQDPEIDGPIFIDLGNTDETPKGAFEGYHDH